MHPVARSIPYDEASTTSAHLGIFDVFLPSVTDASTQASTSIAQLLAVTFCMPSHHTAVVGWIPWLSAVERLRAGGSARNARRLYHLCIPVAVSGSRHLTTLLRSHNIKVQPWRVLCFPHPNHSIRPGYSSFSIQNILLSFPCCSQQTEL